MGGFFGGGAAELPYQFAFCLIRNGVFFGEHPGIDSFAVPFAGQFAITYVVDWFSAPPVLLATPSFDGTLGTPPLAASILTANPSAVGCGIYVYDATNTLRTPAQLHFMAIQVV
jgi:hypothetical protein